MPEPTLWNSQLGRRQFLGKFGKASVGAVIVMNMMKLNVVASGSAFEAAAHEDCRRDFNNSFRTMGKAQIGRIEVKKTNALSERSMAAMYLDQEPWSLVVRNRVGIGKDGWS